MHEAMKALRDFLAGRRREKLRGRGSVRDASPVIGMDMPLLAFDGPALRHIQQSAIFERATRYFDGYPHADDLDGYARAVLFVLVRLARPRSVVLAEGCGLAMAEVVSRGLWENAKGIVRLAESSWPRDGLEPWPDVVRSKIVLHRSAVLDDPLAAQAPADLVVIQGQASVAANADALRKAGRIVRPSGIVVLSGVTRPVLEATQDFVAENRDWAGLGNAVPDFDRSRPQTPIYSSVEGTPFIVIQRGA